MSKSQFVTQALIPTLTSRTLARVQWLLHEKSLEPAFKEVVEQLKLDPKRQDLTAIFLSHIQPQVIEQLLEMKSPGSGQTTKRAQCLRQLKQELGMYIPIRLVQLCGAEHVLTLRDGRAASPRKIPVGSPNALQVSNYTPHMLTETGLQTLTQLSLSSGLEHTGFAAKVGFSGDYETINREERNLSAILYYLLSDLSNVEQFLTYLGFDELPLDWPKNYSVFFEFALLRDLWSSQVKEQPDLARQVILDYLPEAPSHLKDCSIIEFNRFWGASTPSSTYIQMPATWSISKMDASMSSELLLQACYFKWSFNAKPDLVLCLSKTVAVCCELKLESGVDQYPSSEKDKKVFKARGLKRIKQTDVQRYLMEELMGFSTRFVLINKARKASTASPQIYQQVTWSELLANLNLTNIPLYMRKTLSTFLSSTPL